MRERVIGAGLLVVLVLGGGWWCVRSGARDLPRLGVERGAPSPPGATSRADGELVAPSLPTEEAQVSMESGRRTSVARAAPTGRGARKGPRTRGPIRGRLVIAGTTEPLDEVLSMRLRTGDLSVAETLHTAPDGSFVSALEFPRGHVLARVLRPAGDEAVDHESWFDPQFDGEWVVPVPWPNFLHGRLVDRSGAPLAEVQLALVQRSSEASAESETDAEGDFRISGLGLGRHTLYCARGFERQELLLDVQRGPNELGDLRLAFSEFAGDIGGRLVAPDGPPRALVRLVDLAHGTVASQLAEWDEAVPGSSTFLFRDLPAGEYRLELLSRDGHVYEPASQVLSPPATGLLFDAQGRQDPFRVRVRGPGGSEVRATLLVLVRGAWLQYEDAFARAEVERWIALAPGLRSATGGRPEPGTLEVALEDDGFAHAFLFFQGAGAGLDLFAGTLRGRALAGVEVVADGRAVARSDGAGLALVDLAEAPERVDFRLAGWQVLARLPSRTLTFVTLERD